jgi:hypothetical protein
MISIRPTLVAVVACALLTACASGPAPIATASLPVAVVPVKKPVAKVTAAKKPVEPVATAYDGPGSKSKCGERHLAYQAGKTPETTMKEKVARDLECTAL